MLLKHCVKNIRVLYSNNFKILNNSNQNFKWIEQQEIWRLNKKHLGVKPFTFLFLKKNKICAFKFWSCRTVVGRYTFVRNQRAEAPIQVQLTTDKQIIMFSQYSILKKVYFVFFQCLLRGNYEWAPPRLQIIFVPHPFVK